jgi:hypothetical protein
MSPGEGVTVACQQHCWPNPYSPLVEALIETQEWQQILGFHEVDDLEHWLHSPKRQEFFGPLGITGRLFTDPTNASRVGLIVEVPDMEAFQKAMQSEAAADAMKFDGVRPGTLVILEEASDHI